jgi:hypothetical protein
MSQSVARTFPRVARWGVVVVALHNAEEALTIPTWLPPRLSELEAQFGIRPPAADPERLYSGLLLATLVPAVWVALATRSAPRSAGAYSILALYGVFLANAFVPHLLGALWLGSYVPGALTAGGLVVPFSLWLGYRAVVDGYASRWGLIVAVAVACALYFPACAALLGAGAPTTSALSPMRSRM